MKNNPLSLLLMLVLMACSSLPPLVSLDSGRSDLLLVTIYKAPT